MNRYALIWTPIRDFDDDEGGGVELDLVNGYVISEFRDESELDAGLSSDPELGESEILVNIRITVKKEQDEGNV